jgi:hypothetical protein
LLYFTANLFAGLPNSLRIASNQNFATKSANKYMPKICTRHLAKCVTKHVAVYSKRIHIAAKFIKDLIEPQFHNQIMSRQNTRTENEWKCCTGVYSQFAIEILKSWHQRCVEIINPNWNWRGIIKNSPKWRKNKK